MALHVPYPVTIKRQWPSGGDTGIQLPQAAGGGVSGVGESFLAGGFLLFVHGEKAGLGHIHFATHLQDAGIVLTDQCQGHTFNGAHVLGDVFTGETIAAGGGSNQAAVFVQDAHGQAV